MASQTKAKSSNNQSCGYACTVAVALGDGIRSVGEDIAYGLERSYEGLGGKGERRIIQIGFENEYLAIHLKKLFDTGLSVATNPLTSLIASILAEYYKHIPDEILNALAKKAGEMAVEKSPQIVGKQIGKTIGKKLAKKVAVKIAKRIAATAAMKTLAKRIGVSATVSSTGVGIPVSMVMFQGLAQKASKGSQRLRISHPELWLKLRSENGLDMLYFLIEAPMKEHLNFIADAAKNTHRYKIHINKLKKQLGGRE